MLDRSSRPVHLVTTPPGKHQIAVCQISQTPPKSTCSSTDYLHRLASSGIPSNSAIAPAKGLFTQGKKIILGNLFIAVGLVVIVFCPLFCAATLLLAGDTSWNCAHGSKMREDLFDAYERM